MAQRTLFSVLLEQPWWISALVGVALFGIAQLVFPPVAPFVALPFLAISAYVGYRQLRTVSPGKVEERLKALRELSWDECSQLLRNAYARQGYEVEDAGGSGFDFAIVRQGRRTLVQARRWKVNQLGIGPLQELAAAVGKHDAYGGIVISAGGFSPNALEFAQGKPITIVTGIELAALAGAVGNHDSSRNKR